MLEQVARSIFAKHAAALGHYDPRRSGAEYWSLCIDADDDDVGLHWDKDFALEAETGTNLTPAVATVTYLTAHGAPTIMLSRPPPGRWARMLSSPSWAHHGSRSPASRGWHGLLWAARHPSEKRPCRSEPSERAAASANSCGAPRRSTRLGEPRPYSLWLYSLWLYSLRL